MGCHWALAWSIIMQGYQKMMGLKTTEIEAMLGFKHDDEVIH
jgi:hypothetical protein